MKAYRFLLLTGIVWGIILFAIFLTGCSYVSTVSFNPSENSATLKSNVKASVKINTKEQTAEINQIGISPLEKLKALIPQNVEVAK